MKELREYIRSVIDPSPEGEINFELWLDDKGKPDDEGLNMVKFTVMKEKK